MPFFEHLTPDSTLGDLPLYDISVHQETPGRVVAALFEANSSLPGVLVADEWGHRGLVSRQRFRECIHCPSGLEQFLHRPIATFATFLRSRNEDTQRAELLILPKTEKIYSSVQRGLERSSDHCYDPIVVISEDQNQPKFQVHALLDFHLALQAQSHIVTRMMKGMVNGTVTNTFPENSSPNRSISPNLDRLNQQLMAINRLLSKADQEAFNATFVGIQTLYKNSENMVDIGQSLRQEVNTIGDISKAIAKISRQVHHLSVKASIIISQSTLANPSNGALAGFSTINEEIGNLVSQTFEAGHQIEQVSTQFRQRIEEFVYATQEGMGVTRSLMDSAEQAQIALQRIEDSVSFSANALQELEGVR